MQNQVEKAILFGKNTFKRFDVITQGPNAHEGKVGAAQTNLVILQNLEQNLHAIIIQKVQRSVFKHQQMRQASDTNKIPQTLVGFQGIRNDKLDEFLPMIPEFFAPTR